MQYLFPSGWQAKAREEYLQQILEPVYRNIAFDENNEFRIWTEDAMYSFMLGAFRAGVLEAGPTISHNITATQAGNAVILANQQNALIENALTLDPKTEAYQMASKISDGSANINNYNVGELLIEYVSAGGDASFMYTPSPDMETQGQGTAEVQTLTSEAADVQLDQEVADSIQSNVQTNPEGVQAALAEGMSTLTKIETRIRQDSGIANHEGIGLETIHDTYMSYARGEISSEAVALAMAENIKAVMQTQMLTVAEKAQLMSVMENIIGDVDLTAAYVGQTVVGEEVDSGARAALEGLLGEIDSERSLGDNGVGGKGKAKRPTWRESENSALKIYTDYEAQRSFLNGVEVKYGTKGSSRPDLYQNGSSVEVKNYNVETKKGRDRLVKVLEYQVNKRIIDLPIGTEQIILIDIRGQNVDMASLKELRDVIRSKCATDVIILFMR